MSPASTPAADTANTNIASGAANAQARPAVGQEPLLSEQPVAPAIAPVEQMSQPSARAANDADGNSALAGLLGLLALVGLGGAGFMMMRHRRHPVADEAEPMVMDPAYRAETVEAEQAVEPTEVMEPAAPVHVAPALAAEMPRHGAVEAEPSPAVPVAATMDDDASHEFESPFVYNRYYKGKAPQDRPVFVMPEGPVPTGAARAALLDRMIAARPDADNPCTSPKGRLRRARSLLSQRERALREQALQPFDFRRYEPTGANRREKTDPVPHMA